MKRLLVFVVALGIALVLLSTGVCAEETESLEEFSRLESLLSAVPDEGVMEAMEEAEAGDLTSFALRFVGNVFSIGLKDGVDFFLKICALLLFSALFGSVKDSFGSKGLEGAFDLLFSLSLAWICFSSLQEAVDLATTALNTTRDFFLSSLPVTTILMTLSGAGGSASTLYANLSFMLGTVTTFLSTVLSPLVNTLFSFSMLDGVMGSGLSSLFAFLQKTAKTLCVLLFTLVGATLSLQNALAGAADSVAMRSVRFAAGNFIPVVGPLVGESARTLAASFSMVKTQCGTICLLVLGFVILKPILTLAVRKLFLVLGGAVAEVLGEGSAKAQLSAMARLLDLMQALLVSQGVYLVFYVTLFLKSKGNL